MKISGFTFVKNAVQLYYPIVEAISSILPICDEIIVACGDSDDGTTDLVRSIGDDRIRIIETVWDPKYFVRGAINARQTNVALDQCTGDWCFYMQADEVVHERDLPGLREKMARYLDDPEVEGLLFDYKHFYGDYDHYQIGRNWYRHEVRIVRNGIGAQSWESAQSFRKDGRKLRVVRADADIYHYGWVRPPKAMTRKQIAMATIHKNAKWIQEHYPDQTAQYDFGKLKSRVAFTGTHPAVMKDRIADMNWKVVPSSSSLQRHDRLSNRVLSFLESKLLGIRLGEFKNYVLLDREESEKVKK